MSSTLFRHHNIHTILARNYIEYPRRRAQRKSKQAPEN